MIRRPGAILALLTGLNLLNYLDRYVLAAVLLARIGREGLPQILGGMTVVAALLTVPHVRPAPTYGRHFYCLILHSPRNRRGLGSQAPPLAL